MILENDLSKKQYSLHCYHCFIKMAVACSSETLVTAYHITPRDVTEESNIHCKITVKCVTKGLRGDQEHAMTPAKLCQDTRNTEMPYGLQHVRWRRKNREAGLMNRQSARKCHYACAEGITRQRMATMVSFKLSALGRKYNAKNVSVTGYNLRDKSPYSGSIWGA